MLDTKLLRENPDRVRKAIAAKGSDCDLDAVIAADAAGRSKVSEGETQRARQKAANAEMAKLPKGSPEFVAKVQEMKTLSAQLKEGEAALGELEERF